MPADVQDEQADLEGQRDAGDEGSDEQQQADPLRKAYQEELRNLRTLRKQLESRLKGQGEQRGEEKQQPDALAEMRRELDNLRTERRRERIERQVIDAAGRAGAKADKALRIVRLYADDLDVDDESGAITNLDDVIAQAREDEPGWFGVARGSGDGGTGQRGNAKPDPNAAVNALIRKAAGR